MIQRLVDGQWLDVERGDWGRLTVRCRGYARQLRLPYRAIDMDTGKVIVECLPK